MQSRSIPLINPPIKIPATINLINTHGSIPIKTHHQPNQYPRSIPTDQYPVTVASTKPTHHVPESFATVSFLGLVHRGLSVGIVSTVSEIGEIDGLRWDRWTDGEMKRERVESENFLSEREARWEEREINTKIIDTQATVTV